MIYNKYEMGHFLRTKCPLIGQNRSPIATVITLYPNVTSFDMKIQTSELLAEIQKAVKNTILTKKFGIAFSGGVDSSLLAKIC